MPSRLTSTRSGTCTRTCRRRTPISGSSTSARGRREREAERVSRPADDEHVALLALLRGELVGVATYEPAGTPGRAEIAFAVSDDMHGRGVATLLLEHLVSVAGSGTWWRSRPRRCPTTTRCSGVFADAGLPVERQFATESSS